MSGIQLKLVILAITAATVASQLLLKGALATAPKDGNLVAILVHAVRSPLVYLSLCLQVVGYAGWMFVIAKEKLGIAVAISGSFFYILVAMSGWLLYGEALKPIQWVGLATITAGVILVSAN
jgi:drug/metabolite transporter (DMT)-like permease